MDPSLSQPTEKNKGRPKKSKKDKKERKERKKNEKEKQTVSIDLTSPARARAHTPPGPDAAQTPTRVPSQHSGKRGRYTTRREEAQPQVSKNNHTYNSKPLPFFSSNDSTGPPSAGPPGTGTNRLRAKSAAAVPDRSRTNDTERSTYSHDCKIKALETCLSLKDRYLDMPPAVQTDQEPFWTQARDSLERKPITRGKFKDWQAVQKGIESWCQPRRSSMREERLPAVSQSHPELDELVDQWNLVFAQRFCKIHMGYFTAALREPVNSTTPPSQAAPPGLQRPMSSLGPTQQGPTLRGTPPFLSLPARPSEKSWEVSSGKRKDLDLPTRSHARTNSRGSGASFKDDNNPKASSHDQAKRPRYESHFSDLPPATNFALGGRDIHGTRTPSSQRSRPRSPQRPKTSYGPIETQVHRSRGNDRIPTMTTCPTGPDPTTEPRTDLPRRPAGSQTPGDY
ncbi:uncharacterized protein FIESC28_04555 [Fusarium coffeatum]|uniref:Uncharacterized protein n=1 Tax=Fusarium coffeatum TaxID=231269 RepID=A0A366RZ58_9HYPO|nr:uncharacterized protein FIESC28_04555 [Fusarium coffeatum]RBR22361.1 hypothetical protein FIESC28_04555 [Fusarium coffeatum]